MNNENIYTIENERIPFPLTQIPEPPKKLFVKGNLPKPDAKILCIVGTRRYTAYGELVVRKLIEGLKGYNICIVSGLAKGIDSLAHKAALENGLQTIAFPGSGLDPSVLYPPSHRRLADEIIYNGGGLISEFEMIFPAQNWTFPLRNRLMAGISQATIIIEAKRPSGSMITTRLAHEYSRDVGAVPGDITSEFSDGPNWLLRSYGMSITNSADILELLGFDRPDNEYSNEIIQKELLLNLSENEMKVIELLQIESLTNEQLILKTGFIARDINEILSSLEIQGFIIENNGKFRIG